VVTPTNTESQAIMKKVPAIQLPDELPSDVTGDLTGDLTGDWLRDSLDLDDTGETDSERRVVNRVGVIAAPVDEDETESWARTVIGDRDLGETEAEEPGVPVLATPPSAPAPAPALTGRAARKAAKPSSAKPTPKAPSGTSGAGHAGSSGGKGGKKVKLTRRQRRKLRRQDKRDAEHEAKLLMYRRPLWRGRIVPKTVLGISFTMLTTGLALATSGTLLYMNYRYRQDQSDALVRNFPQQVRQAQRAVQNEGRNARSLIRGELEPLQKLAATAETLTTVLKGAEPSVWAVRTFDVDGQGTAGTAFVVASDDQKTFMLTSLSVVQASTAKPGPDIKIRKGDKEEVAKLWTWDESRDLALLVVDGLGAQPPLSWAAPNAIKLGDQIFDVSGFGSNNASIAEGRVSDLNADGIQHSAPIGTHFRGGPIIDGQGRVVAIASRSYAPLGFPSDGIFFAPPISGSCDKVLRCLNNRVDGAGAQR
jgi:S1-C subfamily serine protease